MDQHTGSITRWQDFENFNWLRIEEYDFFAYEYLNAHLPDGLGLTVSHAGDDMGYRSVSIISPDDLWQLILPWHKRFTAMAHERRIPYFLHSCGNLENIMSDLIEDVQIDGKHSFEDAIIPVEDFYRKYGNRIVVLGGLDINILSAGTPAEVRVLTRSIMESCASGCFAIGSGNSIPDYIPVENYLAMINERHRVAAR